MTNINGFLASLLSTSYIIIALTSANKTNSGINYEDFVNQIQQFRGKDFRIKYPSDGGDSRRQKTIPKWITFPCTNVTMPGSGRSSVRPTSVHKLRPGDVDVVGAMGDSLVAGNGALEDWALGTFIENRGVSWCAGGQGTWRQFLTVPNILKEFNPSLTGYSTGTGEFLSWNSQMNVAFPVSADADALHQAKVLVMKMKRDPNVNFKKDWKLVTVFFGANDLCSAQCYNSKGESPYMHATKLMVALDYLEKNMPRTIVNLVPVIDVSVSLRIKRSMMCRFLHTLFCSCFHQIGPVDEMTQITTLTREYQKAEELLINSGRYEQKDDFTVVLQPFMKAFNAPTDPKHRFDEVIDITFITHDCFHFSQKGHALGANLLWNNMLEPTGKKSTTLMNNIMEKFLCPTDDAPFLFTNQNSKIYLKTGRQY